MSTAARIAFLVFGFTISGWLFWLTYRSQRVLDHAEGAVDIADRLLSVLERRMATRGVLTWLGDDAPPGVNRAATPLVVAEAVTEETIAGIVGATVERMSTAPQPATTPATVPTNEAIDAWHRALAQRSLMSPSAEPDAVDMALSQFRFNPGQGRGRRRQQATQTGEGDLQLPEDPAEEAEEAEAEPR